MRRRLAAVAGTVLLAACAPHAERPAMPVYPMLDGDCAEFRELAQAHFAVGEGVTLYQYQDHHYVWFCYTIPKDSFGTTDLRIEAPAPGEPLNLHVSAQLGEWPANRPDLAPVTPDSDRWWNHRGWTGYWTGFNGFDTRPDKDGKAGKTLRFARLAGREIQLDKRRFGRGEWRWRIEIRAIMGADGKSRDLHFPAQGDVTLMVD